MSKRILIYGGSSLISKELIKIFYEENYSFVIFCRKSDSFFNSISSLNIEKKNFSVFEAKLEDLDNNLKLISKIENNIDGIIWVAGYTGDPSQEFNDTQLCQNNINVNFLHPVLIINKLLTKINSNQNHLSKQNSMRFFYNAIFYNAIF